MSNRGSPSRREVKVEIPALLDRQPPQAPSAEAAVLGSMLLDGDCIADVAAILPTADAFYTETHQHIYRGLLELGDKHGASDVTLVAQKLVDAGHLDSVGGVSYLVDLTKLVPTSANATYYAGIVAEKYRLRRLIQAAGTILHDVYENREAAGEDALELIHRAEASVCEVSSENTAKANAPQSMGELAAELLRELMAREDQTGPSGLLTGFTTLDTEWIKTGLRPGQVIVVAGRPSIGKTSLGLNVAQQVAAGPRQLDPHEGTKGEPVAFFSMEMSKGELIERVIASEARVPSDRIASGQMSKSEWNQVLEATRYAQTIPLYIDDTPALSVTQIRVRARKLKRQQKIKLIVIDYIQLMRVDDPRGKNRNEQVGEISRGIKALAKELGLPIILLAQLNRGAENREGNRPRMADLRESGSIENDADIVILIHREAYYHKDDPEWMPSNPAFNHLNVDKLREAELIIAKQRGGPTGVAELEYIGEETRFVNKGTRR